MLGAELSEIQVAESLADLLAAQFLSNVAADDLHRPGCGHKLPCLSLRRLSEVEIHQLLFEAWRLVGRQRGAFWDFQKLVSLGDEIVSETDMPIEKIPDFLDRCEAVVTAAVSAASS